MKKTNKPKIGGILTIISGALASLGAVNYAVGLADVRGLGKGDIPPFVPSIIFGVPIMSIVVGILALIGGVFAMRRKKWGWSPYWFNCRYFVGASVGYTGDYTHSPV